MSGSATGTSNIAIGELALATNDAAGNIAIGTGAMAATTVAAGNIAIGTGALAINEGDGNIAIGEGAAAASVGSEGNIAIGAAALEINIGLSNIALGNGAFVGNTLGVDSIAIGTGAGVADIAGISNVWLACPGFPSITTIGIGTPFLHNIITIPELAVTLPGALAVAFIPGPIPGMVTLGQAIPLAPSSRKFKHDIVDMNTDSENIYKLRPVRFVYNDDAIVRKEELNIKQYGLIAEEVAEIFPELVGEFQGELFGVKYDLLSTLLLNEMKKMNTKVIELQEKAITIEELRADNEKMKEVINTLMTRIKKLEARA
jgi:hypothetical protein